MTWRITVYATACALAFGVGCLTNSNRHALTLTGLGGVGLGVAAVLANGKENKIGKKLAGIEELELEQYIFAMGER